METDIKNLPLALLVYPPVYDFALYDLYLKPYPLLRLAKWFKDAGYNIMLLNYLKYSDSYTINKLKKPKRKKDGTGHFFKSYIEKPEIFKSLPRNFHRYGILEESAENKIKELKPDVILVSSVMTYWYPGVKEAVNLMRKLFQKVPVIIGGIYATLCKEHCEKTIGPDFVIAGDAFPELSNILNKAKLPYTGLALKEEFLLCKKELYDSAVIRINSGCSFSCDYCASNKLTGDFSEGDPELAYNTVYEIHKRAGTVNFAFLDDALLFKKEKILLPFLEKIISSNLGLNFYVPNAMHLAYLDREAAVLMKRAGFHEVRIGFESSDPEFHGKTGKKLSVDELGRGVEILKSAGFDSKDICVYILAGLPGQRAVEVEESIKYASEYKIRIRIAQYSPVPYTKLWERSIKHSKYPLEEEPLTHNNTVLPMEWEKFTLNDLEKLKKMSGELSCR